VPTEADYVRLGGRVIQELLDQEYAVVWPEVEAKLADDHWPTLPPRVHGIDTNHLVTARRLLLTAGLIVADEQPTRGGRRITVYHAADTHLRTRRIRDAAARKRLLETRYLGWASGSTAGGPGIIGTAGEAVVHAALTSAAPYGYRLVNPVGGEVRSLLGAPVPGGPLDNGAFLLRVDAATGRPDGPYLVLVEVKNIRSWIFPGTAELHQLLDKAARIQTVHPDERVVPVLVCRRAHYLTNLMAKQLGFYVVSTSRQYIQPSVAASDPRPLDEVNNELGYSLTADLSPPTALVTHFTTTMPGVAQRSALRWAVSAVLGDYFRTLRGNDLSNQERRELTTGLAAAAGALHPPDGSSKSTTWA
jgi:hypothetical protein